MRPFTTLLCAMVSMACTAGKPAEATVIQITELGQIVSYTDTQFLTGNGGSILGTVGGYNNDRGFLYSTPLDRYVQITELGQIVAYTYDQFLTGNGGSFLGTVGGYIDDVGFLYHAALDRYVQITELGQIVAYTYDQFLTGNGGSILGTVGGYNNDRGFLYVPNSAEPPPTVVALPATAPLVALSLAALAFARRWRASGTSTKTGPKAPARWAVKNAEGELQSRAPPS